MGRDDDCGDRGGDRGDSNSEKIGKKRRDGERRSVHVIQVGLRGRDKQPRAGMQAVNRQVPFTSGRRCIRDLAVHTIQSPPL